MAALSIKNNTVIENSSQELMTTKQLAGILNVSERTIQNHAKSLGITKNGVPTYFTEEQATEVKRRIEYSGRNDLVNVCEVKNTVSNIERQQTIMLAWKYLQEDYEAMKQRAEIAEKQLIEQQPKVEFYDDVTGSSDTIDMGELAKVLNIKGLGRNKLFEFLRNHKILDNKNQPYQKYVDMGLFRIIESKFSKPNGDICINLKIVVFQKGVDYIRKMLKQKSINVNIDDVIESKL